MSLFPLRRRLRFFSLQFRKYTCVRRPIPTAILNDNEIIRKRTHTRIELIPNKWQRQTISRSFGGFYFSLLRSAFACCCCFSERFFFLFLLLRFRLEFFDYKNAESRIRNEKKKQTHDTFDIGSMRFFSVNVGSDGIRRRRRSRQTMTIVRELRKRTKYKFGSFFSLGFSRGPAANYIY